MAENISKQKNERNAGRKKIYTEERKAVTVRFNLSTYSDILNLAEAEGKSVPVYIAELVEPQIAFKVFELKKKSQKK